MGREANGIIDYGGRRSEGRVLLEADELILRGGVKARIAKSSLANPRVEGDDLVLDAPDGRLAIGLGTVEAGRWIKALARPAPSLAGKLGLEAGGSVWTWGQADDVALKAALADQRPERPQMAALHLAIVGSRDDLSSALAERGECAASIWLIYRKGNKGFGDCDIRTMMRDMGYIDSKACGVSDVLTATRYGRRKT